MDPRLAVTLVAVLVTAAITIGGISAVGELTWSPRSLLALAALASAVCAAMSRRG